MALYHGKRTIFTGSREEHKEVFSVFLVTATLVKERVNIYRVLNAEMNHKGKAQKNTIFPVLVTHSKHEEGIILDNVHKTSL